MDFRKQAELWLEKATDDKDIIDELKSIMDDEELLKEHFYCNLSFGTAGLRGVIGAGTNRMNIYTVRKATQGLADYINKNFDKKSVAIAHDSRIKARLFSEEAARVLAANGIKVYITNELQPTPVLSYLVREFGCSAGIMITASHNPAKYNGYKCYGSDGCQLTDEGAQKVYNEIEKLDIFSDIKICDYDKAIADGTIEIVSDELYDRYTSRVLERQVNPGVCEGSDLKVVYTPLNGAGNKLVRRVLKTIGINNITVVKEQEMPDGNFPTCSYPNPEFKEALSLGLELCKAEQAELLLATDPDSDRVGVAVKYGDDYQILTGNEIGVLLLEYILSSRKRNGTLPKNPVAVKTIVSTSLTDKVAKEYGCELRNVLTGFKYIGEQIGLLEKDGEEDRFVFGYEESYGYLAGTYVRDKDAVVASMLVCELAAYYKSQGKSLADVIDGIYKKYGYCINTNISKEFEGISGLQTMQNLMSGLREEAPSQIAGYDVIKISDYLKSEEINVATGEKAVINLPKSNVLVFDLAEGNKVIIRPSGTEPKVKFYITADASSKDEAQNITDRLLNDIENVILKKYI